MHFSCGDSKLLCITFCTHINAAEYMMADVGLHDEGATAKPKVVIFCKIIHKTEASAGPSSQSPGVEAVVYPEYIYIRMVRR
jgi:hypothetical protein